MKKLVVVLALTVTAVSLSWAGWMPQVSNTSLRLNDVCFVDSLYGWAVGGYVFWPDSTPYLVALRTTDGGTTWLKSWDTTGVGVLKTVTFVSRLHGWALADSGIYLESTDGGVSWHNQPAPNPALYPFAERFVNDTLGYMTAGTRSMGMVDGSGVGWTTDGGLTWNGRVPRAQEPAWLIGLDVQGPHWAWAVGGADSMVLTRDAAKTWLVNFLPDSSAWCYGVAFGDTAIGVAVGPLVISRTSDGGFTWTTRPKPVISYLWSAEMPDTSHAWACGNGGAIIASTDGGMNWETQVSGTGEALHKIWFVDSLKGWAVGDSGVILHTDDGGRSGVELANPSFYPLNSGIQCYPNPTHGPVKIRLRNVHEEPRRVSIYDAAGRKIKEFSIGVSTVKENWLSWDGCDLQGRTVVSGVYLIRLESHSSSFINKLLVVR